MTGRAGLGDGAVTASDGPGEKWRKALREVNVDLVREENLFTSLPEVYGAIENRTRLSGGSRTSRPDTSPFSLLLTALGSGSGNGQSP